MEKIILAFICFLSGLPGRAQLCQGSLGDAIVSIDFGQGSNPGQPLNAAATGYLFSSAGCPNDGYYTVTNSSSGCFGSTWHNINSDHTGNTDGYFMLVNASYQPSDFYVDTVSGLCGGSTYEFAAWIMNVIYQSSCNSNSIVPDLTFRVETTGGTLLQSYNTGSIAPRTSPLWVQYGSYFTTPAGVSTVVLRIRNNAPGGCGNDLALDDITFRPCGPLMNPTIDGSASMLGELCEGSSRSFTLGANVSPGFNNPVYQWQQQINGVWTDIPTATTITLIRNFSSTFAAGDYKYRLAVAESGNMGVSQCRINSPAITIRVNPPPATVTSNNGPLCEGSLVTLSATGAVSYQWTGPQGFVANSSPVSFIGGNTSSGKYYVTARSSAGCFKLDSTTLVVYPSPVASVTNASLVICNGDSTRLGGIAPSGTSFTWSPVTGISEPGIINPNASPSTDTKYFFIVSNQNQCSDSAEIFVKVNTRPVIEAGPDKYLVEGQTIQLEGSISGTYQSFSWTPSSNLSNSQTLHPFASPAGDTRYYLNVSSACGSGIDSVEVKFYKGLYIPNSFSPNGDYLNDTWNIPVLYAYPGFKLSVYNRFGQRVFYSETAPGGWDGKFSGHPQSTGMYIWDLYLPKEPFHLKGTLLLLR